MRLVTLAVAGFSLFVGGCAAQGYYGDGAAPYAPNYLSYATPSAVYVTPQVVPPPYYPSLVGHYDNGYASGYRRGYYSQRGYGRGEREYYPEQRFLGGRRYREEDREQGRQAEIQQRQQQYNRHVVDLQTQHNQNVVGLQQQFNQGRLSRGQLEQGYRQLENNLNRGIGNEQRALPR